MSAHTCHWPGCDKPVPASMWGCSTHWFRLSKTVRNRIHEHYRPGQEIDRQVSPEYIAAALAARAFAENYERGVQS